MLVVAEEHLQDAFRFGYVTGGSVALATADRADIAGTVGNVGTECITYDARDSSFVSVKQDNPQAVLAGQLDFVAFDAVSTPGLSPLFDADGQLALASPSDVQTLSAVVSLAGTPAVDNLLLLSLDSRRLGASAFGQRRQPLPRRARSARPGPLGTTPGPDCRAPLRYARQLRNLEVSAMQYRRLGRAGLRVSALSLGSWVTYHNQVDAKAAVEMMAAAFDAGVNFFDNAEVYAGGQSEVVMGEALRTLKWPRLNYVVSTKFFWGLDRDGDAVNRKDTLNRKYLMQAIDGSLKRLQLEHVDLIYCHRPDPHTPIEETARAMSDIIEQGKALYWGTSEWSADEIRAAWMVCERHGWHRPVVEQPQYHLFHRKRVEQEYARLYDDIGLGLTTWSPLASGLLTGKYRDGVPAGSRGAMSNLAFLHDGLTDKAKNKTVARLDAMAGKLGGNVAQLALAWAVSNPRVSSVIMGASKLSQLRDNLGALELIPKLTPVLKERIEEITSPLAA